MEMKCNPIVNGDLSEVPRDEEVIFTVLDEDTGEVYTTIGEASDCFIEKGGYVFAGRGIPHPVDTESIKAWMKLPEPYRPGRCDMCKHNEQWTDCFGDRWSKCKFSERMFTKGCPTEKEVD